MLLLLEDTIVSEFDFFKSFTDYLIELKVAMGMEFSVDLENTDFPSPFDKCIGYDSVMKKVFLREDFLDSLDTTLWDLSRSERNVVKGQRVDELLQYRLPIRTYDTYQSVGQQNAVRTVFTCPSSRIVFVNLPTGSGKSFVFQSYASFQDNSGIVVCVVPTIALKNEQAQRYFEEFRKEGDTWTTFDLVWPPPNGDYEAGLRNIESGTVPIIFCAPESFGGPLLECLLRVSRSGRLHSVFIDEAHLLVQWGEDFRPHYGLLPAILNALDRSSPNGILEVLLSATWSTDVVTQLKQGFCRYGKSIEFVDGAFLRPEIRYQHIPCSNKDRDEKLLQALLKHPFPVIIYCLKVATTSHVERILRELGIQRIGVYSGKTSAKDARRVQNLWRDGALDVMVATSAFGVGMDKADVRTVVHYELPETLDRYYQDCGRGGRDGNISSGVLLKVESDFSSATGVGGKTRIGVDKGKKRFESMLGTAQVTRDGSLICTPGTLPDYRKSEIEGFDSSSRDTNWNWQTLILLQRMGVLSMSLLDDNERDEIRELVGDQFSALDKIKIDIRDVSLDKDDFWSNAFDKLRLDFAEVDRGNAKYLQKLISDPAIPICDLLMEFYNFNGHSPEISCNGCTGHSHKKGERLGFTARSSWFDKKRYDLRFEEKIRIKSEKSIDEISEDICRIIKYLRENNIINSIRCSSVIRRSIVSSSILRSSSFVFFKNFEEKYTSGELCILSGSQENLESKKYEDALSYAKVLLVVGKVSHPRFGGGLIDRDPNTYYLDYFMENKI